MMIIGQQVESSTSAAIATTTTATAGDGTDDVDMEMDNKDKDPESNSNSDDMEIDDDGKNNTDSTAAAATNNDDSDDDIPVSKIATTTAPPKPTKIISAEKMQQLTLMKTFLVDAIKFIEQIHKSVPIVGHLLSSKSKLEVVESMDFFMTAYLYKVKLAKVSLCI
jgi:condensin complex subunit 1